MYFYKYAVPPICPNIVGNSVMFFLMSRKYHAELVCFGGRQEFKTLTFDTTLCLLYYVDCVVNEIQIKEAKPKSQNFSTKTYI